jgi:hypothetical protein
MSLDRKNRQQTTILLDFQGNSDALGTEHFPYGPRSSITIAESGRGSTFDSGVSSNFKHVILQHFEILDYDTRALNKFPESRGLQHLSFRERIARRTAQCARLEAHLRNYDLDPHESRRGCRE